LNEFFYEDGSRIKNIGSFIEGLAAQNYLSGGHSLSLQEDIH
jgi:hypothetical protein